MYFIKVPLAFAKALREDFLLHKSSGTTQYSATKEHLLSFFRKDNVLSIMEFLFFLPVVCAYYFYVRLPLLVYHILRKHITLTIIVASRQSSLINSLMLHYVAFHKAAYDLWCKARSSTIIELVSWLIGLVLELQVAHAWLRSPTSTEEHLSISELAELLAYEEIETEDPVSARRWSRMQRTMHRSVPAMPFRATVRIRPAGAVLPTPRSLGTPGDVLASVTEHGSYYSDGEASAYTPGSFPGTPMSRDVVLGRTAARTDNVIFSARDKLQLQLQAASKDSYSRRSASTLLGHGQYGTFDPYHTAQELQLSSANHCITRVVDATTTSYASSRSMFPVRFNAFVYIEFSVSVARGRGDPMISVGLGPSDAPLDICVGEWNNSIGLRSDGYLVLSSRTYQTMPAAHVSSGDVVGMLIYVPNKEHRLKDPLAPDSTSSSNSRRVSLSSSLALEDESQEGSISDVSDEEHFLLHISLNGRPLQFMEDVTTGLSYEETPLYPTASINSHDTSIWCGFNVADIKYNARWQIGAPMGENVYCLDGSLLLDADDNRESATSVL